MNIGLGIGIVLVVIFVAWGIRNVIRSYQYVGDGYFLERQITIAIPACDSNNYCWYLLSRVCPDRRYVRENDGTSVRIRRRKTGKTWFIQFCRGGQVVLNIPSVCDEATVTGSDVICVFKSKCDRLRVVRKPA